MNDLFPETDDEELESLRRCLVAVLWLSWKEALSEVTQTRILHEMVDRFGSEKVEEALNHATLAKLKIAYQGGEFNK